MFYPKQLEILKGVLNTIAPLKFPAKTYLRRIDAVMHDPRLPHKGPIMVDAFLMEDLKWWVHMLEKENYVTVTYEFLLKRPDQGDFSIWTDASGGIGVGGFMGDEAFQVKWTDTSYYHLIENRKGIDIQLLELLGSLVALELWWPKLVGKSVTLYNDNAAAASAIESKAPALWRNDLHYLIREITKLAIQKNFYFWGIHIAGDNNDIADALSRFKSNYDWPQLGFTLVHANHLVQYHFDKLYTYYPNRDPKHWQWTDKQKRILQLKRDTKRDTANELGQSKKCKKPLPKEGEYNILQRKTFD